MALTILFLSLLFCSAVALGFYRYRQRRYLKLSVGQAMDPKLKIQVDEEIQEEKRRADKFKNAMKKHGF